MTPAPYRIPGAFRTDALDAAGLKALGGMLVRAVSLPALAPRYVPAVVGLPVKLRSAFMVALGQLRLFEARTNAAAFVEYALANEQNGQPLVNGQHHNEWHDFLDTHLRAVLLAPVEHAKTTHIAVGRVLFALGCDPSRRLAVISNTSAQASKILGAVKLNIETNPRVREVFPNLLPSRRIGDPWHNTAITVQRDTIARDPSVQALGIAGPLVGSRLDGAILDDVLDFENTRTADQLAKLLEWYETTLLTRIVAGGWIHVIGTPWADRDLLHELEKRPGYASKRYSAVLNPDDPRDQWRPMWPAQFSLARLLAIYDETTPGNFARKYLCKIQNSESARFQGAWIDAAIHEGRLFQRFPLPPLVTGGGRPLQHFTGVDLAVGAKATSDLTVILTIAIDDRGRRILVDLQSGRWQAPDILAKLKAVHETYQSQVLVEDNGAQAFLLQWAQDWGVPARPFTTGRNKYDERYGIESLAVEMRSGLWVIPSGYPGGLNPELKALVSEMVTYQPDQHTGDRLMAMWFAREGARQFGTGIQRNMPQISR